MYDFVGQSPIDKMPYLKFAFANGPGYSKHRSNLTNERISMDNMTDREHIDFLAPAMVPLASETHGGEDVVIYANGPYAHLFTGSMEENEIPHFMAYAGCIGSGLTACDIDPEQPEEVPILNKT